MLRSFAYAAAMREADDVDGSVAEWEQRSRDAFLRGYLRPPLPAPDLPVNSRSRAPHEVSGLGMTASVDRLIALFEMEKVFYELTYELNNRPSWSWIPMRGIARLAVA